MKYGVYVWMVNHDWVTRFPRLFKFWDWVVMPSGLGLWYWFRYCLR